MTQFIAILRIVMLILPILGQLIQAVEQAMPASGQGAAKLAMVQGLLEKAYGNLTTTSIAFEAIWPVLQPIITGLVGMYKATGMFPAPPSK